MLKIKLTRKSKSKKNMRNLVQEI